jgi:adenylate kinase
MQAKTIIFIGPQGSGKGTQVELLKTTLATVDPERFINHVQTGKPFRELAAAGGYTAELVKNLIDNGKFVPDVLTNAFVVKEFVDQHVEGAHILFDGYPRNEAQAMVCNQLFEVYNYQHIDVIHLNTPEAVVIERMLARGREDDTEVAIAERLRRYRERTEPLLEFYRNQEKATVHVIDGGAPVETVQSAIHTALGIN